MSGIEWAILGLGIVSSVIIAFGRAAWVFGKWVWNEFVLKEFHSVVASIEANTTAIQKLDEKNTRQHKTMLERIRKLEARVKGLIKDE